jgi:hypothetical protein
MKYETVVGKPGWADYKMKDVVSKCPRMNRLKNNEERAIRKTD